MLIPSFYFYRKRVKFSSLLPSERFVWGNLGLVTDRLQLITWPNRKLQVTESRFMSSVRSRYHFAYKLA